jgi:Cd2+/Zn2+-exporting ATPase
MALLSSRINNWISRHRQVITVAVSGLFISAAWVLRLLMGPTNKAFVPLMTLSAVIAGFPVAKEALGRLLSREFSIPLLVTIAAAGALWIGEVWEAAAVTFLYVFGSYLESLTLARTRQALRTLINLSPKTARVKRANEIVIVPASEVNSQEIVVVMPGDRVPVDGEVIEGRASLDTSPLTGEPLPAEVGPGDSVLGGSVCQGGYLEIRADKVGPDTTFSRILFLVAEAQEQKPKVQRTLDRFAAWYTPLIITLSVVLYLVVRDIELSLTFLVIGCPGALVVASPVAVVAGLGNAARKGILIKGGERLERIGKVNVVAFDKTGTLTMGKPKVSQVESFIEDRDKVISLAAAAEMRSEHHLANAILEYAKEQDIKPCDARDWSLLAGLGVTAETTEGTVLVGNRRLLDSKGVKWNAACEETASLHEDRGATLAFVALNATVIGLIAITDPLRPEAQDLVSKLKELGIRKTIILTGDNQSAAQRIAGELGVDEAKAELLPEDKVQAIRDLQTKGYVVAMVGDGINDAPALATADVSIAMGVSGTEAAIEAADIALMTDKLGKVPQAIGLSRSILRVVRQNVIFAVAVVALLLAGVIGRVVFLSGGMLIHEASVLLVILNGMRLLKM